MIRRYLSVPDVLAIHDNQISYYGGANGLRDPGQLESALFRPQSGYYKDLIEEASALWESLSQNHPFVDGNKRTALVCMLTFIAANGLVVTANDIDMRDFVSKLYTTASFSFENLDAWLRKNTAPL